MVDNVESINTMYCPQCKSEYLSGVSHCRDCGAVLVDELMPDPHVVYDEVETVFASANPAVLAVAKSLLMGAGIKFAVKNEIIEAAIFDGVTDYTGPVEIIVARREAAEARELLQELSSGNF